MVDIDRVWQLMKKISICMFTHWDGQELRARPMAAYLRREDNAVLFLSDARHHPDDSLEQFAKVCLAFADTSAQNYVSLAGNVEVSRDPTKIRELWGTPAKAWWPSPDDPNIRVLRVTPIQAEYWDAPGATVAYVKMATAALTGTRPNMGENRKVAM
jgi:general stress protein 26